MDERIMIRRRIIDFDADGDVGRWYVADVARDHYCRHLDFAAYGWYEAVYALGCTRLCIWHAGDFNIATVGA